MVAAVELAVVSFIAGVGEQQMEAELLLCELEEQRLELLLLRETAERRRDDFSLCNSLIKRTLPKELECKEDFSFASPQESLELLRSTAAVG